MLLVDILKYKQEIINSGKMKYVYKSTAQKNGDILKIYKGDGLVVATKLNEEWVTLLEDGKGW